MAHPYVTRRARTLGLFAFLLLIGAGFGVARGLPVVAFSAAITGSVLLAFAVYTQIRFGPRISEVPRTAPWPPQSFHGWFDVFMFVVAVIGMLVIVLWHVLRWLQDLTNR
jgi:hypothetical protein